MTDQTGATTLYGYDDQGQLTSVTDPLEQRHAPTPTISTATSRR